MRTERVQKRHRRLRISKEAVKNILLVLIILAVLGSVGILGLFAVISKDLPDPNSLLERTIAQSTKIYDRTGEHLLYEIHGEENRTLVKMAETFCGSEGMDLDPNGIPIFAIQATIAAEDRAFCEHHGFSIKGIARAVKNNLLGGTGGGSTLTQQLVKNAILTGEHTISRKIKELVLSIEIERRFSKDEILQIYFNEIGYGSTNYGIQAASQHYLGKSVNQITLSEAATLAALPQRPTSLLNNPDLLKARRDWILNSMAELGFVTQAEADTAIAEEIAIRPQIATIEAPHFVFYVKELLEDTYGQREVEESGLKVITSIDYDLQMKAQEIVTQKVDENGERYQFTNASLVAMDPKTGQVLAMVGSKDYFNDEIDGQVNVALRPRQPGSSFKPFVYLAGFERGYTPNTILWDVKTNFPTATGNYSPNNYDGKEHGPVTIRTALQGSLNIPAVKMLYLVGVDNTLDFADKLGYTTFGDRSNFGLAIVLGGAEVTLLDHTHAYAALANEGVKHDIVPILRVEDSGGRVLEEWKENEGEEIIDPNAVRTITNVLADNAARAYVFGAGSALQLGARPVAAKSGTTNDYRDGWLMGYTPSLAVGVWAGNNDNAEMTPGGGGSMAAGPIWNEFMKQALEGTPIEYFTSPVLKATGKAMLDGQMPGQTVTIDTISGKLATEYTPAPFRKEVTYAEYHNILQYVDKNNPLGEVPADPAQDPYYEPWETAVQDWIKREEAETGIVVTQGSAPTESDDVHVPENFPSVSIESPSNNMETEERTVEIQVNASAPRGISRVEFYIDSFYLGLDSWFPYTLSTAIPSTIGRGYHTLKTIAYDDVDNAGMDSIGIRLATDGGPSGFSLLDPKNGQTIERTQETFTVVVSVDDPSKYENVSVYAQRLGSSSRDVVGTAFNPTSPFITIPWTLPADGDWVLTAHAESFGESDLDTAGIVVTVQPVEETPTSADEAATDTTGTETPPEEDNSLPPASDNLNPFATPNP